MVSGRPSREQDRKAGTQQEERRQARAKIIPAGLELDLTRLRGKPLLAEALGMTGSAVARIPVAVLPRGARYPRRVR
jgi:hypothetical protein